MNNPNRATERILVVEDEPSIGNICRRVLAGEGYEVEIAVNGRVAQDMIEEKQFSLCLVDIRTPKMNGKELYQWLEKKYPQVSCHVIFTTGDVMGGDTQTFIEQSGRPFLPKPFTPGELITIIKEVLKQVE